MRSHHVHDHHGFMTIYDNVLTVGESAGIEERADQPHPCPGGNIDGTGKGAKNY